MPYVVNRKKQQTKNQMINGIQEAIHMVVNGELKLARDIIAPLSTNIGSNTSSSISYVIDNSLQSQKKLSEIVSKLQQCLYLCNSIEVVEWVDDE